MKRVISLILTVILVMLSVSACALEARDSNYFSDYGTSISKKGDGDLRITFTCGSVGTASQLGVSSFSVHRYNGSNWEVISGPHSGSYGYNASSHTFSRSFNGVPGEKYRVEVSFVCVINGTFETKNYTSGSVVAD